MRTRPSMVAATAVLLLVLATAAPAAAAAPPVPLQVAPTSGADVITPLFQWNAVDVAATVYEIQVGPSKDPVRVTWTATTPNTSIAPTDAAKWAAGGMYWRVRAKAPGGTGEWSPKVTFTKSIPAPTLTSPAMGATVAWPVFDWSGPLEGVASYQVDVSAKPTFTPVAYTFKTYMTKLAPRVAIAPGNWYWRVRGVDADGHLGTASATGKFIQAIGIPELVGPNAGQRVSAPTFSWKLTEGAVSYKLELASSSAFTSVKKTYATSGLSYTPTAALANGTWYWRVRGVNAAGKVGAPSVVRKMTLATVAATGTVPTGTAPGDGATITGDPAFTWTPVAGATRYLVRVSTSPTLSPAMENVTTVYPAYSPATPSGKPAYANGTYYWRVEARSRTNAVIGTGEPASFTVAREPTLLEPGDGATVAVPSFSWEQAAGAKQYRVVVSKDATFVTAFDSSLTADTTYVPELGSLMYAYPAGTYYWEVEVRSATGAVLATSPARSFTVEPVVGAVSPDDGATLGSQPVFRWQPVEGAKSYRVVLSESPTFVPGYATIVTDFTAYAPFAPSGPASYPIGTYYWRVEAVAAKGGVIASTTARSFSISAP
jgi:hypothetical protein